MTSKTVRLLYLNAILFLIAAIIGGYLVWHHYELVNGEAGFGSFCSINQTIDCDAVNASKYSELLGIPLATWAFGYYLFALITSLVGARNAYARREALLIMLPLSFLSMLASVATLTISASLLKKYCLMCATLQFLNLATFAVTVLALRNFVAGNGLAGEWRQSNRKRFAVFSVTGLLLFAATALATEQLRVHVEFDSDKFLADFRARPVQNIDIGNSPRQGFEGDNPPVRLVEFADFQCPACANSAKRMHHLLKMYEDKIQLVFKNFPLDPSCNRFISVRVHEFACVGAKSAYCAQQQGKFVDYYEKLFENRQAINPEKTKQWAAELGLDKEKFDACVAATSTEAAIQKDAEQAMQLGVESTPTFFANGKKVEGMIDETKLKLIIKELGK